MMFDEVKAENVKSKMATICHDQNCKVTLGTWTRFDLCGRLCG